MIGLLEGGCEEALCMLGQSKRQLFKLIHNTDEAIALICMFNSSVDSYISSPSIDNLTSLTYFLRVMALGCAEYEFSYLSYCHHAFLSIKKLLSASFFLSNCGHDSDSECVETASEYLDEVISSIITSGFSYPGKCVQVVDMIDYDEKIKCDMFTFKTKEDSISAIVRKMQRKMHGEGQQAVGYVMWSSAVILSRIICRYSDTLVQGKSVLEVACGLGLCGIIAAHFSNEVTITDFNEAVLKQLVRNVAVNQGDGVLIEGSSPVIPESCHVMIKKLDWDNLSINRRIDVSYKEFNVKGGNADNKANIIINDKILSILPDQVNENNPCKALSSPTTDFPLLDSSAQFDVIIGSDVVCQASDSVGLVKVMNFLKVRGHFICVCPLPHFRYGTEVIMPALRAAGLVVAYAPIAHSTCKVHDAITQFRSVADVPLEDEERNGSFLKEILDEISAGDDAMMEGLPEREFTVYMLICATRVS